MQDFGLVDLPYPLRKVSLNPLGVLAYEGKDTKGNEPIASGVASKATRP